MWNVLMLGVAVAIILESWSLMILQNFLSRHQGLPSVKERQKKTLGPLNCSLIQNTLPLLPVAHHSDHIRLYVHSATSYGVTTNDNKSMIEGYPQKTIFQSAEEGGHSF